MKNTVIRALLCAGSVDTARIEMVLKREPTIRCLKVDSARELFTRLRRARFDALIFGVDCPDLESWRLARTVASQRFSEEPIEMIVIYDELEADKLSFLCSVAQVKPIRYQEIDSLPAYLTGIANKRPKVLVIEDEQPSAKMVTEALEDRYSVEIAPDGRTGLSRFKVLRPDIVILDLGLPDLPGDEVLQRILAIDPNQPVLILTGNTSLDAHLALTMSRAFDFRPKPIDIYALRQLCIDALEYKKLSEVIASQKPLQETMAEQRLRIRAALALNLTGRNNAATAHLKNAIHTLKLAPLSDEEWERIKEEF